LSATGPTNSFRPVARLAHATPIRSMAAHSRRISAEIESRASDQGKSHASAPQAHSPEHSSIFEWRYSLARRSRRPARSRRRRRLQQEVASRRKNFEMALCASARQRASSEPESAQRCQRTPRSSPIADSRRRQNLNPKRSINKNPGSTSRPGQTTSSLSRSNLCLSCRQTLHHLRERSRVRNLAGRR
jgi:hypothetical protein